MIAINYCIPCSTPYANSELKRIYSIAQESSSSVEVTSSQGILGSNCINITYGYLGVFCNVHFKKLNNLQRRILDNSYIIDHSYTPKEMKGQIFRLSKMNDQLETQIFNQCMVSGKQKDLIHEYLKKQSTRGSINLLIEKSAAHKIANTRTDNAEINILIKHSSLQERIKGSAQPIINNWKKAGLTKHQTTISCAAFKPWEMKVDLAGRHRVINHFGERIDIDIDRIRNVYCPSSMMALDFILMQCPTRISIGHPLYRIIGNYVPKLTRTEAIELAMLCITRISFSLKSLKIFNDYMRESFE